MMKLKVYKKIFLMMLVFPSICKATIFNSAKEIFLPTLQTAIVSGDLNKDGIADLILGGDPVGTEQGKIRVLLGNGNGTFNTPVAYQVGYNPSSFFNSPHVDEIKVEDLDNDGNLDVIVAHNGERNFTNLSNVYITVLFGEGNGSLRPGNGYVFVTSNSGVVVTSTDVSDFNNDGRKDIVLGCQVGTNSGTVFFMKNMGNRQFHVMEMPTFSGNVYEIAAANFNNDSYADLVMTTHEGIYIFYGNGNFFYPEFGYDQRDAGIFETGLVVRDFNSDGRADFAVVEKLNKRFRVFLNNQNGFPANPILYETSLFSDLIKSTDINGDGKLDLIISDNLNGKFQIFHGTGSGAFGNSEIIENNLPVSDFTFADFDLNNKTDIAFSIPRNPPAAQAGVILNAPNSHRSFNDFDGDGKADIAVFRPSNGAWYILNSTSGFSALQFGLGTDKIVAADYDGDGKTDVAVFRNGTWYLQRSSLGFTGVAFGNEEDIPQPSDYNGDGKAEIAIFRPSNGTWYVYNLANNQFSAFVFGQSGDIPVTADYDGDGKGDYAIFRPSNGTWYLQRSNLGFIGFAFGYSEDIPVAGDYDGDGRSDMAVFRPSSGIWYLQQSTNGFTGFAFGLGTDFPTPADYDGDGKTDVAVFRDGIWYLQRSQAGFTGVAFGRTDDHPITNIFMP